MEDDNSYQDSGCTFFVLINLYIAEASEEEDDYGYE
jgi:hypothetical protein